MAYNFRRTTRFDWGYVCDVEHIQNFEPAITLKEIQTKINKEMWAPPHLNFRGYTSIIIPAEAVSEILQLRQL